MLVLRDGERSVPLERRSVVAIGVFDGLHLGHQKVLATVCTIAVERDATPVVVTFDPHPAWVLAPERAPLLLGTLGQRLEAMERLGVEFVRVMTFDENLANESAKAFIERVLVNELRATEVVVGRDFRFGHDRLGGVELLDEEGARQGFGLYAAPIYGAGTRWSSSIVRQALFEGDLEVANATLGRPFTLRATVVHGDARGAQLGYPTANLDLGEHQLIPQVAIYAGAAHTEDGRWWPAAISIGTRPQFYERGQLLVEVHLVGFDGDLYGQTLDVALLERLRGEMSFDGVDELVVQIGRDVEQTVGVFKNFSPESSALLG